MAKPGPLLRYLYRVPILLYHLGGGWVFGRRFLLLVHRGRRSGRLRRTVLEVIRYDPATQESTVASAYGTDADWYRNLRSAPAVEVRTGGACYAPVQRMLTIDEAEVVFDEYARRHPLLARALPRLFGLSYDGTPASRRAVAARLPMVAFRPRLRPAG